MMTRLALGRILGAALAFGTALPAFSETLATGAEIKAALSGNTYQGSADEGEAYIEFYAADGTIKGKDYTGKWTIDGDRFCIAYDTAEPDCMAARLTGDTLTWILDDGSEYDTGKILKGNPNKF